ncbi:phosphoribosylaminoimidazole carboxylase, ATPase subunit [Coccidioides immitis RS]|uniref:Phosphoribosylaminoimidazole carboxylase n=4 Tax=Coccidioides immitis TaxID=5501 RepID=J3KHR6_COCIM|nr:phosphoribosylaminoimidazole carboxylase, ATPase subunit [Coccidioides immitis RS]KMP00681.1 phosphoribosylaminoimidazole carboxylase [Coccidioides immitis RMSCC 2394]KMU78201.1 phosphoribosylaminoimidazole carboxylase [Coccidioides immitis RMSCC 3703]KMU85342.1 phosphoribosylaminoimidazole carboxylase [Coccidioides immitis H538.4]TPX26303.1 phosphoribosylaminoimidazole carboxylase ade2 [Coccidioides immitis]EAS35436.3 phosphoribosylaminoimidazole carboxylase, ATPase subunit [Coccidioides i
MACSKRVGVLGGGQLGRMLMESANRLNIQMNILDADKAPAKQISAHDDHITGSFMNRESVRRLAANSDVLTAEIEHVDTHALEEVESLVDVQPSWKSIRIIQDKFAQKQHLAKFGIPQAEYRELKDGTAEELSAIGQELGFPLMLKSKTGAYDGRGNYAVKTEEDIPAALEALKGRPLYAEKWAKFVMELAVMVVKTKDSVLSYPTVETVQENSICKLVYAPARNVSDEINKKAQKLARDAVAAFDGKGVFGVEMFLLEDNSILLCELASRIHNSGHYTIEACPLSQFDTHLRAILDLPIPPKSLQLRQPAIMLNILGGSTPDAHLEDAEYALSIPNASVHLYGKGPGRLGRKMGHVTVTAPTMREAEELMQPLIDRTGGMGVEAKVASNPRPTIGVVMGSDSDLKTLVPGLRLLEEYFGVKPEVDITSAHRTPDYMAEYASTAASRGIKVIIAAAGGAAHLPGMAAAHTSLPVIGVPVKGSALDGVDSLYSIVQMPRGVPVATVGINNSVNAALLAVRILGCYDETLRQKVAEYAKAAKDENLDVKGVKMREIGWEKYFEQMQTK